MVGGDFPDRLDDRLRDTIFLFQIRSRPNLVIFSWAGIYTVNIYQHGPEDTYPTHHYYYFCRRSVKIGHTKKWLSSFSPNFLLCQKLIKSRWLSISFKFNLLKNLQYCKLWLVKSSLQLMSFTVWSNFIVFVSPNYPFFHILAYWMVCIVVWPAHSELGTYI